MKFLVPFAAAICIALGSAIPTIPGDNSNYVEGESRYIWMPDGSGNPVLVDLEEKVDLSAEQMQRNGALNSYWLYTRLNPNTPQVITINNINTIYSSNFRFGRPIVVVVHGWNNNGNSDVNVQIRSALLQAEDVNVIVVDWSSVANSFYFTAVAQVPSVGQHIGTFVSWLISATFGSFSNVHLVGHSLGAHIVGNAGRSVNGQISRITGLDPAGPSFASSSNALTFTDGIYVEAIHTDGGSLGIMNAIAAANFYPNGGRNPQPGCSNSSCSHGRAYQLFAASVINNHFLAQSCSSLNQAASNSCTGYSFRMGNNDLTKRGFGIFALTTGSTWPY